MMEWYVFFHCSEDSNDDVSVVKMLVSVVSQVAPTVCVGCWLATFDAVDTDSTMLLIA